MRNASSANSFAGDASHIYIVSDREYTVFSLALATYVFICSQGGKFYLHRENNLRAQKKDCIFAPKRRKESHSHAALEGGKNLKRNNHYKSGTLALNFFLAEQYIR